MIHRKDVLDPFQQILCGKIDINIPGVHDGHHVTEQCRLQRRIRKRFFQCVRIFYITGKNVELPLQFIAFPEKAGFLFPNAGDNFIQRPEYRNRVVVFPQCLNDRIFNPD